MNKRKKGGAGNPPKASHGLNQSGSSVPAQQKSTQPQTELRNANLLLNRLSRSGEGFSWIESICDKENKSASNDSLVDQTFAPLAMVTKAPDVKKKVLKTYNVNLTSIDTAVYDENWATKQANSFTDWMNFTFSNALESPALSSEETAVICDGVVEGNANGLKILLQKKDEAISRQKCYQLYHSADFLKVLKAVEQEICEGRLVLRDDRDVLADLGLQEQLFSLIFSYEMPWIRLGLEIVFGEIISLHSNAKAAAYPCKSNCSKWKNAIKTFVSERLLANPDLVAQYTKQQLLCAAYDKKLRIQTRQHTLKKFLALVILLDRAKKNVILPLPTLFVSNAPVKCSKDVILTFSREIMRGEGDVMRHLGLLGYHVSFAQSFIDEFDYTVTNLAVDLRDGVRLARLMELLTHTGDISAALRVPAVSRLQKLHNVGLVFKKFKGIKLAGGEAVTDYTNEAKNIVDGNRDRTLFLLWQILYGFELKMLISPHKVLGEAALIAGNAGWRRSVYDVDDVAGFAVHVAVKGADGKIIYPQITSHLSPIDTSENESAVLTSSLLRWCEAIASTYGVPVHNLTTSLADGRALCLLIHYYHPTILPTKIIQNTTSSLLAPFQVIQDHLQLENGDENAVESLEKFTEATALNGGTLSKSDLKRGLEGERKNFKILKRACHAIGGIPLMLPAYDTTNPPEEKTMTIFLGYVFSRMIESSSQVRAAIRIQRFVRKSNAGGFSPVKTTRRQSTLSSTRSSVLSNTLVTRKGSVPITVAISQSHAASIIMRRIVTYVLQKKYVTMRDEQTRLRAEEAAAAAAEEAEMLRLQTEEEAEILRLQEEAEARVEAEAEMMRLQAEEEAEILRLQEEEEMKAAVEYARVEAEAEMMRLQAEEEAEMMRVQVEEEMKAAVENARVEAEAEMMRVQEEEEARAAVENARMEAEAEMMRLQAEEEAEILRVQEEEEARAAAKAEADAEEVRRVEEEGALFARQTQTREEEEKRIRELEAEVAAYDIERLRLAEVLRMQIQDEERIRKEEEACGLKELEIAAIKSAHDHEIERLEKEVESSRIASVFSESARSMQEDMARISSVKAAQKLQTEREKFAREAESIRLNAENEIARLKSEKQDLATKAAMAAEADRQRSDDDTAVIEWLRKGLEMREAKVKADCAEHQKMLLSASEATAKAERRLQEAARKHEEDLLEAQENRKLQDQEAERIHKEQQEVAVAEMRIIIENEIKAKYEAARVAELQAAQDLKEASEELTRKKIIDEEARLESIRYEEEQRALQEEFLREEEETRLALQHAELVEAERVEIAIRKEQEDQAIADAEAALQAIEDARIASQLTAFCIAEKEKIKAARRNSSATTIQSIWRTFMARTHHIRQLYSVLVIQAAMRGHSVRIKARKAASAARQQKCVVVIQCMVRSTAARTTLKKSIKAVCVIQLAWRQAGLRKSQAAHSRATKCIEQQLNFKINRASKKISGFFKNISMKKNRMIATLVLQKWYRAYLPLLRARVMIRGFLRLQAFFRAYKVRSSNSVKVGVVLKKIVQAQHRALANPKLRMGNQTDAALHVLQTGKMISQLLKACQTLELSTQLSRRCCDAFAKAGASRILFALIRSCNRSTPHQELLRNALVVLLNVARHDSFASVVADSADAADTLVDLMQMFRDKQHIFGRASELLCRLIYASKSVKATCNSTDYRKRLDGILSIIERKHRLEDKVRKIQHNASAPAATLLLQEKENNVENDKENDNNNGSKKLDMKLKMMCEEDPMQCIQHVMTSLQVKKK